MLLQEKKVSSSKLEEIINRYWKGSDLMTIDSRGSVGGTLVIWDPCQVIFYDQLDNPNILMGDFMFQDPVRGCGYL